jgi:type 1 glutamine amidotransferase
MRLLLSLLPALGLAVSLTSVAPADEPVLKALIVDGQNNHNWQATTPILKKTLEDTGRFAVNVATAPATADGLKGFRPQFRGYDVVVLNYNGAPWTEPTKGDLVEFVRAGGGLVVVHAANNSFPEWPEYNRMIGLGGWGGRTEKDGPYLRFKDGQVVRDTKPGSAGSHGQKHAFVVEAFTPDHPILKGLPPRWMHAEDELYDRLRGPAEDLTVLATAYSDPSTGGTGEAEPMLMVIDFGRGRVFHTTLGHDPVSMSCAGFQTTLARGAEWAATGDVTLTAVPADFPPADKVSTRP